jgi:flagellar biosynthesis/type III secretory pathway M-ring protein FliF/YscJ
LMWFVVRPLANGRAFEPAAHTPLPLGHDGHADAAVNTIEDAAFSEVNEEAAEDPQLIEALPTGNPELTRLHAVVDDKPEETFALLRKWLHETDEEEAA